MSWRVLFVLLYFIVSLPSAYAAACLDIFPSATNDDLTNKGLEFINVPPFFPADGFLANPETISLGDSQHQANAQAQSIFVNSTPITETSARLYLTGSVAWENAKINVGGAPEDLIIVISGALTITGGSTEINAIIYAYGEVSITGNVEINGAVASEIGLSTNPAVNINYNADYINNADFNGMCDGSSNTVIPILDYRFDECSYSGESGDVIDQSSNFNGTSQNLAKPVSDSVINNSLDLSAVTDNPYEWLQVPRTAIDGLDDFTISVWINTNVDKSQQEIFHALGNSTSDDELELFIRDSDQVYIKVRDDSETLNSSVTLTDGNWHHILVTRQGEDVCLFVDGTEEDCDNGVRSGTLEVNNNNAVVIGQEQDDFGDDFDSSQSFDGKLDEFKLYDSKLDAAEVDSIYQNELAENNYDGSARAPLNCPSLLALYRFEQTDLSSQIDDTSGYNNHAEIPFLGASLADGKYCRGFDSVSYNRFDYTGSAFRSDLDLDGDVGLQGTVSFWFNSTVNWNDDFERVLFDASSGSDATDKYFVLEIQEDGRLKFAFEDSNDADFSLIEPSTNSRQAGTWYYLTVTWDYLANDFAIYVDGNLQVQQTKNTNGAMGELGKIVFGDNSSDYTQSGNSPIASPYSSRGNYDETRVYDRVLTQVEIQTDMNDDNGCLAELIAYYQMDELAWNGTSGEVLNQQGVLHGTAFNGLTTDRVTPARVGNPGTCGYGYLDGVNDYIEIADDPALDIDEQLTVSTWIYPTKIPSSGLMTVLSKDENFEFHVTPSREINWWWNDENGTTRELNSAGANIQVNNWYHIAITYKDGEQVIYINGQESSRNAFANKLIVNNDPLQIGQDQGFPGRYFQGSIDEVKIYSGVLSATEVNEVYLETHPCASFIDHFEIDTIDGTGITCDADNIVIKACSDASCSTVNPDAVDVALSINNTFYKTVTVAGTNGTATSYAYTTVGNAALSLDQTYECKNSASQPCNVTFADSGFLFSDIPMQISGKSSAQGLNATTLSLQAVETDTNTGSCVGAFPDGGDIPVNLSYQCDEGTCSQAVVLSNNSNDHDITTIAAAFTLRFSADSTATFDINYPDAAKLILNAQKTIEVEDSDGNKVLKNLSGSSISFVERPFGFFIDVIDNPAATDGNGGLADIFKKAAEDFTVQLKAVVWQSADDANNDGVPDIGADLSNNAVTVNFGNEAVSDTAEINHELVAPAYVDSGVLGGLTSSRFDFTDGIASDAAVSYDEVGIISFTANLTDGDYLGAGDIQGNTPYVGRFTPAYFKVTSMVDGILTGTCSAADNTEIPFVYSGQMLSDILTTGALGYFNTPAIVIEAQNQDGNVTQNYIDDFYKLSLSSFNRLMLPSSTVLAPNTDATQVGKDGTNLIRLTANIDAATLADASGETTYSYNADDNYVYVKEANSEINEFTSDIDLSVVSIIDSDLIETLDEDGDASNGLILTLNPIGKIIRFGRAQLQNSYGPETSNLPQPLSVNYYKDKQYVVATDDWCTPYNATDMTVTDISLAPATTAPADATVSGEFITEIPPGITRAIELTAPGTGNTGEVEVIYDVSDWLKFDWAYDTEGVDGLYNDNPRAVATFGIFRGNDRIIYQREIEKIN